MYKFDMVFSPLFLQVISWVGSGESMLLASFRIPKCLEEAEQLKKEHEQFQEDIEVCVLNRFELYNV